MMHADNFIGKAFDKAVKHVVTRGSKPLSWKDSVRIGSLEAIRKLKKTKVGSGGALINTYRQDGSIPSMPMARIKAKQAAARKAAAKKPSKRKR